MRTNNAKIGSVSTKALSTRNKPSRKSLTIHNSKSLGLHTADITLYARKRIEYGTGGRKEGTAISSYAHPLSLSFSSAFRVKSSVRVHREIRGKSAVKKERERRERERDTERVEDVNFSFSSSTIKSHPHFWPDGPLLSLSCTHIHTLSFFLTDKISQLFSRE